MNRLSTLLKVVPTLSSKLLETCLFSPRTNYLYGAKFTIKEKGIFAFSTNELIMYTQKNNALFSRILYKNKNNATSIDVH